MSYQNLLLEPQGAIVWLTLNRPKALNALDTTTLRELLTAVRDLRRGRAARVLIVTGAGERAFCAGADISGMAEMSGIDGRRFSRLGHRLMHAIEDLPIPVIAAVNG